MPRGRRAERPQQRAQPCGLGDHRRIVGRQKHHGLQNHRDPGNAALLPGQSRTERQAARHNQIRIGGNPHHVLVGCSDVGQDQPAKQEFAVRDDAARELCAVHAEVALHFIETGPQRVKGKPGRFHLALILRGAGQVHVQSTVTQRCRQRDEGMQVAQRPDGGEYNFAGQCLIGAVGRWRMRYCHLYPAPADELSALQAIGLW